MRNDRVLSASYNLQKGWLEFEVLVYLKKGDYRAYSTTIKPLKQDLNQLTEDIREHIEDCAYFENIVTETMDKINIILTGIFNEFEVYSTADIKEKKIAPFNTIKEFDLGEDDNE